MNLQQTSKFTKIPEKILLRMRTQVTRNPIKSGPPYHKKLGKNGQIEYHYDVNEVRHWQSIRLCQITAADAADLMGTTREEVLDLYGVRRFPVECDGYEGMLTIDNTNNLYIWIPKNKKPPMNKRRKMLRRKESTGN